MKSKIIALFLGLGFVLVTSCGTFRNVNKSTSSLTVDSMATSNYHKAVTDTGRVWSYERFTPLIPPSVNNSNAGGPALSQEEITVVLPGTFYIPQAGSVPGVWEKWTNEKKGFSLSVDSVTLTDLKRDEAVRDVVKEPDGNLMLWFLGFVLAIIIAVIIMIVLINKTVDKKVQLKWQE